MNVKTNQLEQRWRYQKQGGQPIWLDFDPHFLCVYCEQPVGALSSGGPAVCPSCDCGCSGGKKWDFDTFWKLSNNARRRFEEMPYDESWNLYEAAHKANAR